MIIYMASPTYAIENNEEEKKVEEEKKEEEKKEENKDEKKEEEEVNKDIVLKVYMHCEACARKVEKSLRKFEGVDDVKIDYKSHNVVVKGETLDPQNVCERIQKKTGRKVEIISPLPKPPEEKKVSDEIENKDVDKPEPPPVVTLVLMMSMHCEACAQVVQRRIRKINGVESVETDLTTNQVVVKGIIDPKELIDSVYKKTGKHARLVPQEEEKKEEEKNEEKEEEKKGEEKKEEENNKIDDVKKSEHWVVPMYYIGLSYPPQIFSDENPNACCVM